MPIKQRLIAGEFREARGQSTASLPQESTSVKNLSDAYQAFLTKFQNFSEDVCEQFGTRDLVYYFREIAQENGFKYVIANIRKDMAIMKRLRDSYTNMEICAMIEFLYTSEQDYLEKARLSINLLASSWINTIYADTQQWLQDQYVPQSVVKANKRKSSQHEWHSDNDGETVVQIGVKL